MRDRARAVVIGGGVGGCSIVYWLTRLGWDDVVLVERADLTSGSTFHSAGLVGQLRSSLSLTRMMMSSVELYRTLTAEVGLETGWREVGSLRLASSEERLEEISRQAGWAKTFGLPLELISPSEARELFPPMSTDGVLGAAFLPTDGYIDPSQLTFALAEGARRRGAEIATNTRVEQIEVVDNRVTHVGTSKGRIETEVVVDAGGMFASEIGALAGVNVPVVPMAHEYLVLEPSGLPSEMPTMRDPSLLVYFRPESGGLIMGGYERHCAPWSLDGIPADFNGKLLEEDWPRFEELMQNAIVRVPSLEEMGVVRLINGPEAFTPDGEFILGPSDVRGFWVAAGFCAHGLAGAGGMGRLVAEWIVEGTPSLDVWHMDSRRFGAAYRSRDYTLARTKEIYETYYDVKYPGHEREAGRPLRVSPTYERLRELGAVFGEKSGWERANWFEPNAARGDESLRPRGWAGKLWSPAIGAEHRACREAAALFDESSFAKIDVSGAGAAGFLESLCANRVAREVGRVTYTQMLNARGGIECDFTVARLADEIPHRHRHRVRPPRHLLDPPARAGGRLCPRQGRHLRARLHRSLGPGEPRDPAAADGRRPLARELSVHDGTGAGGRARALPRRARDVRRRARLGALLPRGVRPAALGRALGGRRRARAGRRWLQGDRLAAAGEGLPRLGSGHHAGGHALRGRSRLCGEAGQGRFHGPRGARDGRAARAATALSVPLGPSSGRARLRAGARGRRARGPRHERRLRLHGGGVARIRVHPGGARRRHRGGGGDLR